MNLPRATHTNYKINISSYSKTFRHLIFRGFWIILLATNFLAHSQETQTRINLHLADVLSIEESSEANDGIVDFFYDSVGDYNSEKVSTVPNSLIITFSRPFDLKVRANGVNFENGQNSIPVNVLTIRRNESSSLTGTSFPVILSSEDQILVHGAGKGSRLNLDLDYLIPQEKSASPDILGKPSGTYTQTITYTACAI